MSVIAVLYVSVELISFATYYLSFGEPFAFSSISMKRNEAGTLLEDIRPQKNTGRLQRAVPHPFVGYVSTPSEKKGISVYGFASEEDPIVASKDSSAVIIGINGGSVAQQLYGDRPAREAMRVAFGRLPQFKGKRIVFLLLGCFAYREPQQFFTTAYYLMIGGRLDVLINLDGKNDATDGLFAIYAGLYPGYPHMWAQMFPGEYSAEALQLLGDVSVWQRVRLAIFDFTAPLEFSVTASTAWALSDDYIARQIDVLKTRVADTSSSKKPYFITGPGVYSKGSKPPESLEQMELRMWKKGSIWLHELAKENGFEYFHFLQPVQYVKESKPFSELERSKYIDPNSVSDVMVSRLYPKFVGAMKEMQEKGVHVYSLTDVFKNVRETIYKDSCCHVNEKGNILIADAIASVVTEYYKQHPYQESDQREHSQVP